MVKIKLGVKHVIRFFSSNKTLARHRKIHEDRKNDFTCSFCTRKFFDKNGLQNHVRTHTGEKPFPCLICHKRFTPAVMDGLIFPFSISILSRRPSSLLADQRMISPFEFVFSSFRAASSTAFLTGVVRFLLTGTML